MANYLPRHTGCLKGAIISSQTSSYLLTWQSCSCSLPLFLKDAVMKTAARQTSTFSFLKLDILPSRILGYVAVQISHLEHGGLWFSQFIERWLPSGHLYDGAAKGPDVCWFAVSPWALVYNFRSHVLQCA